MSNKFQVLMNSIDDDLLEEALTPVKKRIPLLWFDLVPGILYSMSMDSGASEEALLEMANSLFEPAQDNN